MIYRVTKKFDPKGPDTHVGNFSDLPKARMEVQKRLAEDAKLSIRAFYCIYEGYDLVEQVDQSSLVASEQSQNEKSDSQQQTGAGSRFSPTPLPTAPRPSGMPPSAWKREDGEKKDK